MEQFPFNEEHSMIRDAVSGWLKEWDEQGQKQHKIAKSGLAYDAPSWQAFAQEQGMAGISIGEQYGGAGLGHLGRAVVMEEIGYVLFAAPFFSTCIICADIIEAFADQKTKTTWLSQIAAGEQILSFVDARAYESNDILNGEVNLVLDASIADNLIIAFGTHKAGNTRLVIAPRNTKSITITPCKTLDPMRALAKLSFNAFTTDDATLIGDVEGVALDKILTIAYGALGAESVGGAKRCLDMTLEYASQRVQFDRPIETFQVVKHRCADMFIGLESSRSAVYYAANASDLDEQFEANLIAKPYASEAYFQISASAIQMHGGIGFTWEYPLHYFFKRARANKSLFNSAAESYDHLAELIFKGAS